MAVITRKFIVPAYYAAFRCKGGTCRHTCCGGLAVNISQEEYFRLLGLPCSAALRSDLDVALKPLKDADPYRYACISPDFFGRCRLLDPGQEDPAPSDDSTSDIRRRTGRHPSSDSSRKGLCRLQEECGAAALPATCRYFPRSPRFTGGCQCAMANACEETLELLYSMKEWKTQEQELTFDLAGEIKVDEGGQAQQQRNLHKKLLSKLVRTDFSADFSAKGAESEADIMGCAGTAFPQDGLDFIVRFAAKHWDSLRQLLDWAGDNYESVRMFCETVVLQSLTLPARQEFFVDAVGDRKGAAQKHGAGREHIVRKQHIVGQQSDQETRTIRKWLSWAVAGICAHYPSFDRFFQLSLINDLFWRFYPYTGKGIDQHEAETVLPYMISMLLVLCAANLNETSTEEDLIDLFAGFYRMVELTPFDHNCYAIVHGNFEGDAASVHE